MSQLRNWKNGVFIGLVPILQTSMTMIKKCLNKVLKQKKKKKNRDAAIYNCNLSLIKVAYFMADRDYAYRM
jgi:hypothetical protein